MMEINVLDKGFIKLIDAPSNGDLMVVNAMLVSTGKNVETEMTEQNKRRINFLLKSDPTHGSPFEHDKFTFSIKAPIFVAREWFRHRTASYNEVSGRYKILTPEFYVPEEFRSQVGKPGEYIYEKYQGDTRIVKAALETAYQDSVDLYNWMLDRGIAKEQARIVLPLAMYTEYYFTCNVRNLIHFIRLRNSEQAQAEIKAYVEAIEQIVAQHMPVTYNAWVVNGRRDI